MLTNRKLFMKQSPDIRIGLLVDGTQSPTTVIRHIIPYGFESITLRFWGSCGDTDLERMSDEVLAAIEGTGIVISALTVFGNPLGDEDLDRANRRDWDRLIDLCPKLGCSLVSGFSGRVRGKPVPDSMPRLHEVFAPLAEKAGESGIRLAFENCTMGSRWATGQTNLAYCHDAFELLFAALPYENVGLDWEPTHHMTQFADPMVALGDWGHRIFHLHGKDGHIRWAVIRKHGIYGQEKPFWHRFPGFGDSNWSHIISELRRHGFAGAIDIEGDHDPFFRNDLETTGQVAALRHLKECRGGEFVPNP